MVHIDPWAVKRVCSLFGVIGLCLACGDPNEIEVFERRVNINRFKNNFTQKRFSRNHTYLTGGSKRIANREK